MDMENNGLSHIHLTKDEELEPYPWKGDLDLIHIVMVGIKRELSERNEKYELHRLIGALLSEKLEKSAKFEILENEINYQITKQFNNNFRAPGARAERLQG